MRKRLYFHFPCTRNFFLASIISCACTRAFANFWPKFDRHFSKIGISKCLFFERDASYSDEVYFGFPPPPPESPIFSSKNARPNVPFSTRNDGSVLLLNAKRFLDPKKPVRLARSLQDAAKTSLGSSNVITAHLWLTHDPSSCRPKTFSRTFIAFDVWTRQGARCCLVSSQLRYVQMFALNASCGSRSDTTHHRMQGFFEIERLDSRLNRR